MCVVNFRIGSNKLERKKLWFYCSSQSLRFREICTGNTKEFYNDLNRDKVGVRKRDLVFFNIELVKFMNMEYLHCEVGLVLNTWMV